MKPKQFHFKSLKFKISLVIALLVSIILLLKTYLNIRISQEEMESDLRNRTVEATKELTENFDQTDRIKPSIALDLSIYRLMREQGLIKVEVYSISDHKRELVASVEKTDLQINPQFYDAVLLEKIPKIFPMSQDRERYTVVVSPIKKGNKLIGLVSVLTSLNELDDLRRKQLKIYLITTLVSIIFLTSILSIFLNRSIGNPLKEIVSSMEKVKAGNLDIRATVKSQDEIGELAKNFNSMVARIKEEEDRIENFNKELQIKIEEATTELHQRNQELLILTENLFDLQNEMNRLETLASLGQLAASVAHEVGTPLHSISGHVQLLVERGNLPLETIERLKIVQAQIDRLTEIIGNILSSTRLPEPSFHRVNVNSVIKDIINLTQPGLRKKNINMSTDLDSIPLVSADHNQLQQVFLNLITNAIEAMPGGGELKILTRYQTDQRAHRQHVPNSETNGFVTIAFRDSGVGISDNDIKNIFKPFFSMKKGRRAAGLGLAICKKIIKDHRGEMDVLSTVGQGTTFIVKLPAMNSSH